MNASNQCAAGVHGGIRSCLKARHGGATRSHGNALLVPDCEQIRPGARGAARDLP